MNKTDELTHELRVYLVGILLAVVLSAIPFAFVAFSGLARTALLWIIGVCAILQVIVHFRCFLHIDLSRQKRDDLQLILFSTLIVILMVGGTIWIISNQHSMMM